MSVYYGSGSGAGSLISVAIEPTGGRSRRLVVISVETNNDRGRLGTPYGTFRYPVLNVWASAPSSVFSAMSGRRRLAIQGNLDGEQVQGSQRPAACFDL